MKRKMKRYALGGLTPEEQQEYQRLSALANQDPIQDDMGMAPMENNIQGQSSIQNEQLPADAAPAQKKKKSKFGANLGKIELGTMGLLEGADALVTNFIYNPQIRKREAEMRRQLMAPITTPTNFGGDDDQRMYADGGYVSRRAGKKRNIVVEEYAPANEHSPMSSLSMYNSSGAPAPRLPQMEVPEWKNPIMFEPLLDSEGKLSSYSPIFGRGYSRSQARDIMSTLPDDFSGVPVVKSMDLYNEMWNMPIGTKSQQWSKLGADTNAPITKKNNMLVSSFAKGGTTQQFVTDPMMANANVEGGEFMQLPEGATMPINGDKHSDASGGEYLNLPPGTRIFSDKLKANKNLSSALLDRKSKDMTYSKLAKKFDTSEEDDILAHPASDMIAKRTADLMKTRKEAALDYIFADQEQGKTGSTEKFAVGGQVEEEPKKRGFIKKAGKALGQLGNLMPEIVATINNMTDVPIYQPKYQPTFINKPQQMNIQASLNRNLSRVQPLLEGNSGDAAIDNARALQALGAAQDADNQLYQQKFNYDADQRSQVDRYNNDIANQAQMINLQQADKFWDKFTRREQSRQQQMQNIVTSAYHKSKAMQRDDRSLDLVNTMYPNVQYDPETGLQYQDSGNGFRMPSMYSQRYGIDPNDNVNTTYTQIQDSKGNTKYVKRIKEK